MRVLHIITRLSVGGAQLNTLSSVIQHRRLGVEAEILHGTRYPEAEGDLLAEARANGVPLHPVPSLVREPSLRHDLTAVAAIVAALRAGSFDVIHTHTSKAGFIGRLAARLAGTAAVVHTPHGHVFHSYYGRLTTAAYVLMERCAAQWSRRIIALTQRERTETLALGIGRPEQFHIVPSGVELAHFRRARQRRAEARRALGVDDAQLLFGCIGRLVPIKGQDVLLDAMPALMRACPAARLVLVGDGEQREALQRQAIRLGVAGGVDFVGRVDDPADVLAALDVLVVPSRNEGMGRVILEAKCAGVPIIASAVGGIPDLVRDGDSGRLVPPADPASLSLALMELASDGALREQLGANASVSVDASWSQEAMAETLLRLYESVRD